MEKVNHEIPPIYDENSKILILGSFPSVKSRENQFFYHHTQNRFWKVMASIFNEDIPTTIEDKKSLLIRNKVALWDVIKSCEIKGSSDSSIRNVVPNDINLILEKSNIQQIFCNGNKSYSLYKKYLEKDTGIKSISLPSTSPANARFNLDMLLHEWRVILDFI